MRSHPKQHLSKGYLDLKEEGWLLSDGEFNDCIRMPGGRVIIQRIICCHMKFFKENYSDLVVEQIPQTYSKKMARKSEIVYNYWVSI